MPLGWVDVQVSARHRDAKLVAKQPLRQPLLDAGLHQLHTYAALEQENV